MRTTILFLCVLLALPTVEAAPPSEASVEHLLTVMHSAKLIDTMMTQIDGMMKNSMDQQLSADNAAPAAHRIADTLREKMMAGLRAEMSWHQMKDIYIKVYTQTFTQEEIDSLIAFYGSPTGQVVVAKMPEVMQKTEVMTVARLRPFLQHLQADMAQSVREAQAEAIAQAAAADAAGTSDKVPAANPDKPAAPAAAEAPAGTGSK
jgi:uncharacterized protein